MGGLVFMLLSTIITSLRATPHLHGIKSDMLSSDEKLILQLLDKLGSSSLCIQDQGIQVSEILERVQRLEDEFNEKELLGIPASKTFVTLARRRLVEAQQMSLDNFNLLRESRVAKKHEIPPSEAPRSDEEKLFGNRTHSDDLQQTLYEAKTESLTQILNRMHNVAQEEVIKGELNISELDTSSKTLTELQSKYSAVDVLLNGSKRLVKVLDEADKWDRRLMLASLGFLAFAFAYVIYRRILHGPMKLLFWVLLRLIGLSRLISRPPKKQLSAPMSVSAPPGESVLSSYTTSTPTTIAWTNDSETNQIGEKDDISDSIVREYSMETQTLETHAEDGPKHENANTIPTNSETQSYEETNIEPEIIHSEL